MEGKRAIMRETDGRERKKDGRQKGRERERHAHKDKGRERRTEDKKTGS